MAILSKLLGVNVELYEFTYRGKLYLYTSADKTITYNNKTYLPETLRRSNLVKSNTKDNEALKIEGTIDLEVVQFFKSLTPSDMKVIVYRLNMTDQTAEQIFNGIIKSCLFLENKIELKCYAYSSLLTRDINRDTHQTTCNKTLYGNRCGLNEEEYSVNAVITDINPNGILLTLNINLFSPERYSGGGVARLNDGQVKSIIDATSNTITTMSPFENFRIGDNIKLTLGCNKTSENCRLFDNFDNFAGFEYIPNRDPYKHGF